MQILQETALLQTIKTINPDAIVLENDVLSRSILSLIDDIQKIRTYPILMFVKQGTAKDAQDAVVAGLSAFCVNGLERDRIKSIFDIGLARFARWTEIQQALIKSQQDLNGRKKIERAKGLIMERRQINEREAYDLIRRMSMAKGKPMHDVAETILDFSNFLS